MNLLKHRIQKIFSFIFSNCQAFLYKTLAKSVIFFEFKATLFFIVLSIFHVNMQISADCSPNKCKKPKKHIPYLGLALVDDINVLSREIYLLCNNINFTY